MRTAIYRRLIGKWGCASVLTVLFLSLFHTACVAAITETTTDDPPVAVVDPQEAYREGRRALAEGLPQVAVHKLRACLAANPPPDLRRAAVLAEVETLVCTSDGTSALALLDEELPHEDNAEKTDDISSLFWRGQALASLGRWEEALTAYTQVAGTTKPPSDATKHLKGDALLGCEEALLALNRKAEALQICKTLADDPRLGERARLRGAEIALDTNRLKEAASMLLERPVTPSSQPPSSRSLEKERMFLVGRLRLAQKQTALAEQIFGGATAHAEGLTERLLACNYRGWAQACLEQGKLATAEDVLESFISSYPRTIYLKSTLIWLEQLYARDPRLPNLADLRRWAADSTEPLRQAPSLLMLAHVEESLARPEQAEVVYQTLEDSFPEHILRTRAALDLASLRLRENHPSEAHEALAQARKLVASSSPQPDSTAVQNEIDMLEARLCLSENNSARAAALFESVANRPGLTETQAEAAGFNAVLGWLRASDIDRFTVTERAFIERFPHSPFVAELSLEEGLARAARTSLDDRNGRQRAAADIRRFLRDNPSHPRAPEARLALAELAFERPRPNLVAAWHELTSPELRRIDNPEGNHSEDATAGSAQTFPNLSINALPPISPGSDAPPENDRAAYLEIWLADTPGPSQDPKQAIALATRFLERKPDSPLASEVRMKLCEIYFRNEDFSDAETQLELLVEKTPNSPLVESALYLAGLAASRSMSNNGLDKAVLLFEQTARRNGPFKLRARLRQAGLQKRLGNLQDALTLYKDVLTSTDSGANLSDDDQESRRVALAGRGETLFMLGANEPKYYGEAAAVFDQLANHNANASLLWRRQALTQKGLSLEKLGDSTAALAAYDDALNASDPPDSTSREPEWTWFYRAGSYAARLLESQSQWQAAIAIYKKLASANGPLKAEYENLLSRRRLEHFIWED